MSETLKKPLLYSDGEQALRYGVTAASHPPFYNDRIWNMGLDVIDGYLILLGNNSQAAEQDRELQFQALVSGNVVSACFGVSTVDRTVSPGDRQGVAEAKAYLQRCSALPEPRRSQMQLLAVSAYRELFLQVRDYKKANPDTSSFSLSLFLCCLPAPVADVGASSARQQCVDEINAAFAKFVNTTE